MISILLNAVVTNEGNIEAKKADALFFTFRMWILPT